MHCPSCGTAVVEGLSYCNRCGADLKPSESLVPKSKPAGLVWAILIGFVMTTGAAVGGLAVLFAFALEFFKRGFPTNSLTTLAIVGLLMLVGTVALLSRQMSRLINLYLQSADAPRPKNTRLSGQVPPQLGAPREPVSSVTEHTTRTFEPSYNNEAYK